MEQDYDALRAELNANGRYADPIADPNLGPLLGLLNMAEPGRDAIPVEVDAATFRRAAGSGLRSLDQLSFDKLRFFMEEGGGVDLADDTVLTEVNDIFRDEPEAVARIAGTARPACYGDPFGFPVVLKEDLWKVLRNIPGSHMSVSRAEKDAARARRRAEAEQAAAEA